jgi:NADH-quinone oxidoreductase subunit E
MNKIQLENAQIDPFQNSGLADQLKSIINANQAKPGSLMVILNEIQSQVGFVSEQIQEFVAHYMKTSVSKVHGVISFYSFYTVRPRGKHTIKFCTGTACYVGGASQLIDKAKQLIGINLGETTDDGQVTMEETRCVGACSQAPVVVIDEVIHGRVKPSKVAQLVRSIQTQDKGID